MHVYSILFESENDLGTEDFGQQTDIKRISNGRPIFGQQTDMNLPTRPFVH